MNKKRPLADLLRMHTALCIGEANLQMQLSQCARLKAQIESEINDAVDDINDFNASQSGKINHENYH